MIRLKNVSYAYTNKKERVEALKDISYIFESGKLYSIMGPSGSGKSTLLSLIMGFDKPTTGEIFLDKKNIVDYSAQEYRATQVAMIFQQYNLLPYLTVQENAAYPLLLQHIPMKQAYQSASLHLKTLGLEEKLFKRLPSMLSGGEQQRVAIARAVCSGVKVLLADEPTGNLDYTNAQNIARIFLKLAHEQQCTVIMATHDSEIACIADVQLRIRDGILSDITQSSNPAI